MNGTPEDEDEALTIAAGVVGDMSSSPTGLLRAAAGAVIVAARRLGRIERLLDERIPGDL